MPNWISLLQQHRIIAVIRAHDPDTAYKMAIAAAAGGISIIEITWNTNNVHCLIPKLKQELPQCTIGTGTVLDLEMANRAIACGCEFIFTPHVNQSLIELVRAANIAIIPGALTPTEIMNAWQLGANAVKVFPVKMLGGADYIKCLQPVLADIPLIPTGGVTLENAITFLQAGAIAVGLSTDLFLPEAVSQGDWQKISDRAKAIVASVLNSH